MKELLEQLNTEIDGLMNQEIITGQKFNELKKILYQLEEKVIPLVPPVILEAGEKETQENIKKYVLEAEAKGEIVINTGDSLDNYNVDYFIQQPIESILYDLNRDRVTILTFINDEKWINDFACMKVIETMKARLSK